MSDIIVSGENSEMAEESVSEEYKGTMRVADELWERDEQVASIRTAGVGAVLILVDMASKRNQRDEEHKDLNEKVFWLMGLVLIFLIGSVSLAATTGWLDKKVATGNTRLEQIAAAKAKAF